MRAVAVGRAAAIVLVALAPAGCMVVVGAAAGGAAVGAVASGAGNRRSATTGPGAGAAVAVTLSPARDVAAVGMATGDTTWLRGAISLIGRVTATRGDTLRLALTEARGAAGATSFPSGREPAVGVVAGPDVAVRVLSRAPVQTDGAFVGALLGAIAATVGIVVALLVVCSDRRCSN